MENSYCHRKEVVGRNRFCHLFSCLFFTVIFSVFPFVNVRGQVQTTYYMDPDTLDFALCFDILAKNRRIYNQYNDSIFLIKDHAKWVNYFKHRAVKNHQIYAANQEIIRSFKSFLLQHGDSIPKDVYLEFCSNLRFRYIEKDMSDPFLLLTLSRILDRGSSCLPDSLKERNVCNLWRLYGNIQMWNLGGDVKFLREAYKAGMAIFSEEAKRYPYYNYAYSNALLYMSKTMWLVCGIESLEDYLNTHRRLDEFLARKDLDKIVLPEKIADLRYLQETKDEALLRNVYLLDSTLISRQACDSLMRVVIARNLQKKDISNLSYVRTVYLQMMAKQISSKEAWEKCVEQYRKVWKKYRNVAMTDRQLNDFLQPFYTFFYINDVADIPLKAKRRTILKVSRDLVTAFANRKDSQMTTDYVRDLYRLSTHKLFTKYLSYKQIISFISALNVSTQVTTYAHSVHVAKIAEVLLDGILKYQPDLLKGVFGYASTEQVLAHKKVFRKFLHDAGMMHDIGKNAISSVVNNEYLPLTNDEFVIIKQHPHLGELFLGMHPEFAKFHDTTVGHHKWYNGKGGYPEDFDNTKSPVRIMIDIVTLSDCLQAATEHIGRNYRIGKNFEVAMSELREGAGTRYNPHLVALIDSHPDISKKLSHLIADGWIEIYYKIYSRFF